MQTIVLRPLFHRGLEAIAIDVPFVHPIDLVVRKLKGVRWSQKNKVWYLPLIEESRHMIVAALQQLAKIDEAPLRIYLQKRRNVAAAVAPTQLVPLQLAKPPVLQKSLQGTAAWRLSPGNLAALNRFIETLHLKAYSASTLKTYRNEFLQLLQVLKTKPVTALTPEDLRQYFLYCIKKLHLTEHTLHSRMNAIKFYFEQVLGREKFFWEIPRPKKEIRLPAFFNQEEITAIIKAAGNLKHRTMLMLAYSAGLRVSEVVQIKSRQIDSQRMCILVEQAKGKKDRLVMLSPIMLVLLREYWRVFKPSKTGFLFEGQAVGEPYSTRSLQLVIAAAKKKAGILKPGSVHALRHSFATHLLDKGTDVTMIMKLLGHNDIKTTMRYLHTSNRDMLHVLSPLDDLHFG